MTFLKHIAPVVIMAGMMAVGTLAYAVGEDPDKVADYMHSNVFDTAIGKVEYDEKGDLKEFEFAVFKWDENGKMQQLEF